ncbi:MAG TPA: peptide deformylase [Tissierellaceae bacterium]|nr:peptide deformylase [Tissierellaceae bacterium]
MALRKIRLEGDPILRKKAREVENVDDRVKTLLDDMVDTMNEANGIGLAAPQVGILRRVIVIDIGDGPIKLINPEFVDKNGEQVEVEGCLSIPNLAGTVKRPNWVKIKYIDINNEERIIEGDGLLARVLCHEIDHLDGILYTDKVIEYVDLEEEGE